MVGSRTNVGKSHAGGSAEFEHDVVSDRGWEKSGMAGNTTCQAEEISLETGESGVSREGIVVKQDV